MFLDQRQNIVTAVTALVTYDPSPLSGLCYQGQMLHVYARGVLHYQEEIMNQFV